MGWKKVLDEMSEEQYKNFVESLDEEERKEFMNKGRPPDWFTTSISSKKHSVPKKYERIEKKETQKETLPSIPNMGGRVTESPSFPKSINDEVEGEEGEEEDAVEMEEIEDEEGKGRWGKRERMPSDFSGNPRFVYWDTDNTCRLMKGKIRKDGALKIDQRTFDMTESRPSILTIKNKRLGKTSHPFFLLRYNSMKPIDPTIYPQTTPTPEEATRLINLETLKTLSKIEGGKMKKLPLILLMIIMFSIGMVLMWVLKMGGIF